MKSVLVIAIASMWTIGLICRFNGYSVTETKSVAYAVFFAVLGLGWLAFGRPMKKPPPE
ncbi:MAG: hypothetical protein FWD68_02720 [Alphaproteobacteria bacterium]|nr:hypothetical protein [Alphaproteobacteria bacterium]